MKLIVGLGNPGKKYSKTRHNLGWRVIDLLAQKQKWKKSRKANCLYLKKEINGYETELVKPLTYMNNSGQTVRYIVKKHSIKPKDIIVLHDDIDLKLGEIKIQRSRGSAGHKGVQSIIDSLKTNDFTRIRIGIRPEEEANRETEDFVLKNFNEKEEEIVQKSIKEAVRQIKTALLTN